MGHLILMEMGRNRGFPSSLVHNVYIDSASLRKTDDTLGVMREVTRNNDVKSKNVDVQDLSSDSEGRARKSKVSDSEL